MLDRLNVSEEEVYRELAKRKKNKDIYMNSYQYSIADFTKLINYYKKIEKEQKRISREKWINEQSKKNIPLWIKIFFNFACIDYSAYEKYQQVEIKKLKEQSSDYL